MSEKTLPAAVGSSAELGLVPERAAFEAWKRKRGGYYMSRNNAPGSDMSGYQDAHTQGQWEAWQAAAAAERERWIALCKDFAADNNPPRKDYEDTYCDGWLDACNEIMWAGEKA